MKIRRTLAGVAALGAGLAVLVAPAAPAPGATDCRSVSIAEALPATTPVLSWSENLAYDRSGALWVSRGQENAIERYDTHGRMTGSVRVEAPGAVRLGPDGRMYATTGTSPENLVLLGRGTVVSFDPESPGSAPRVVARGLGMPNGLAIAGDGSMYVADSALGLVRIMRDGVIDRDWTARAPKSLAPTTVANGIALNGIAIRGNDAYVGFTESLSGRILRVPLDRPEAATAAVDVTAPLPGLVDDLAWLDDRRLAVTTTTGQVVVTDRRTGARCTVQAGRPLTSLAVAPDGKSAVAGTIDGAVLRLRGGPFTAR
ncbi:hypothetical protein C6V83_17255 [Gordonia iterans]|uniref:SMP-30/Gluconolactonase/LRE-like region domain-containing protein n=1 Tax=Gordonia iterans TaxID=1004901 RepID=A0A2S0KJ82_9ACTN|nr:hypothetical protein [Gordonia iterans]AVM01745.1 hypothetical protein C6V83_17255 [Gordonia iterans]